MQSKRTVTIGAVLSALALSAATAPAVLFDDGTFESGSPAWEDGEGWEAFGSPDAFAAIGYEEWGNGAPGTGGAFGYADDSDGQFGLVFKGFSATDGGFYHDVPVTPAQTYDFHIQSHTAVQFYNTVVDSGSGTVAIVFAWYDGDPTAGGVLVSSQSNDITSSITDGGGDGEFPPGPTRASRWQDWDYMLTAPGGAAYLRTTLQWTAPSTVTGGDEVIRWDNAELTTALDPINESQSESPILELSFQTQNFVTHTVESSDDLGAGWGDAGLPLIEGNDQTQQVYTIPEAPVESYRLTSER